jgi:site-specific recombinase XerC
MLSLAGANPRDYAVLQVFLQTGIRVSELASLRITDIDFIKPSITVRGKGSVEREIALEEKGIHALKSYLALRPESVSQRVFLNYQGEPISVVSLLFGIGFSRILGDRRLKRKVRDGTRSTILYQ